MSRDLLIIIIFTNQDFAGIIEDKIYCQQYSFLFDFYQLNYSNNMNRVSVINFSLHKRIVVNDSNDRVPQTNFKQSKKKDKSPQQFLKRLIKKGLVHYINPFIRPKTGLRKNDQKQNKKTKQNRRTYTSTSQGKSFQGCSNFCASSSVFYCSKNHQTNMRNSICKFRTKTENNQHALQRSCIPFKNSNTLDQDDSLPTSRQAFREFRKISEKRMGQINVQNQRRSLKLDQFRKTKYDDLWKKHPIPPVTRQPQRCVLNSPFLN